MQVFFVAVYREAYMDMSARMLPSAVDCITTSTFYGIVLGLGIIILVLIGLGAIYIHRQNKKSTVAISQK
jgi:multidrug transporter EmrE-like cation transporter